MRRLHCSRLSPTVVIGLMMLVWLWSGVLYVQPAQAQIADNVRQLQQAYLTYYGRAADSGGLNFWLGNLARGQGAAEIRADFGSPNQAEFVRIYGEAVSNDAFFDRAYQNILNRAPDAPGKAFWLETIDNLEARNLSQGDDAQMALANARAEVLQAILDAALDNAERDADVVNNKVILATLITDETSRLTPPEQGRLINLTRPLLADPAIGDPQRFIELQNQILRLIRGDQDTGSLQILLEPAAARDAGAQWRRTGTTAWFDSGVTEPNVPTGRQTVEFRLIQGWVAPSATEVDINADQTTSLTASYTPPSQITYTVTATAGAGGSISPTSQTVSQGATTNFTVIPDSGYQINAVTGCDGSLSGSLYTTAAITGACTVSASFTQTTGPGTLQVTLEPAAAREAGARWRLTGTTAWRASGTQQNLAAGGYTVEFYSVDGWDTPPNRSVTVTSGQTTRLSQTYTAAAFEGTGQLTVILEPQEARDAGAQWQLRPVDANDWLYSEDSMLLEGGSYVVEFKSIENWTAPTNRVVSITQLKETLTVTYRHTVSTEVVDGGGRVSPLRRLVNHQANATFTFIPNEGNNISVSDNCGDNGSLGILEHDNTYTIGPITKTCTVKAVFVPSTRREGEPIDVEITGEETVTRTVNITIPDEGTVFDQVDIMFLVDVSGSYGSSIAQFKARAVDLVNAFEASGTNVNTGLASFSDFPISPWGATRDYAYRLDQALTSNADDTVAAINELTLLSGADGPESQLEALYQLATGAGRTVDGQPGAGIPASSVGWRDEALRIVFLATDANFHNPVPGTSIYTPRYPGASWTQTVNALKAQNIRVFGLERGSTVTDVRAIVDETNGGVFQLDSASSQILEAVQEALELVAESLDLKLMPIGDVANIIQSIEPAEHLDVKRGDTVSFTVEFARGDAEPGEQVFVFRLVAVADVTAVIEEISVTVNLK